MKLCLVHTPFSWPTAPPLGIAYLKGYLQAHNPSTAVKDLDLNVKFFDSGFRGAPDLCEKCPKKLNSNCIPPDLFFGGGHLENAKALFKNEKICFSKKTSYVRNADVFRVFYEQTANCYNCALRSFLKHGKDRAFVERILRPDIEAILSEHPDIIGFSAAIDQIHYAAALAKIIKKETSIPITFGGYFVSFFDVREIMETFPFIDFVVYKEGERALSKLLTSLPRGGYEGVPNLAYRKRGEVIINREGWIDDLDKIPFPDFSDFPLKKYLSPHLVLPIMFSRGCCWKKCAFCAHYQNYSERYRIRSAENVVSEIEHQQRRHGVRYFLFCDEQIPAAKLMELSRAITAKGLGIFYGLSGFRPSGDVSQDVLKKAYESGCRWIYFGVESFTQRLLDLMRKGTKVDDILRIIRWCRKLGIAPYVSHFWGFPTQTEEEVREEARLCERHKDYLTIADDGITFELDRDSDVFNHPKRYGVEAIRESVFLKTDSGNITNTHFDYRTKEGLLPAAAKQLFVQSVNEDVKYEKTSFWEHLLILSANRVRLTYPREYYYKHSRNNLYLGFISAIRRSLQKATRTSKAVFHFYLGLCYERLMRHNEAIREYLKAQRLNSRKIDRAKIHFHLGACYKQAEQYEKAIGEFKAVETMAPERPEINFTISECYKNTGRVEYANEELDKGIIKLRRIQQ